MSIEVRRDEMIARTRMERESAEALLRSLMDCQSTASRVLGSLRRPDLLQPEGGGESVEAAISGTRRLISAYNRVLEELSRGLSDEDLALLEAIDGERASRPAA